jgi:hypothetical protein
MKARANLARHVRAGTRSEKEAIRQIQKQAVEALGDFRAPTDVDTGAISQIQKQAVETLREEKFTYSVV